MRTTVSLNEQWAFLKGRNDVPNAMPQDAQRVDLPHTWNAKDGQDGGNDYFRGTCCYVRELNDLPDGERFYLEFLGANASADVFLNGRHLARHDGGYSTFRVNITDAIREKNLLVVLVNNGESERIYPQTADFTFYGGLYRGVNLIAVSRAHFDLEDFGGPGLCATTEMNGCDARVTLRAQVNTAARDCMISFTIRDAAGHVAATGSCSAKEPEMALTIPNARRWNGRKDPYLYTAEAVLHQGVNVRDKVSVRFGCRTFSIDPEHGFILNGQFYPLRGVSRHQDWLGLGNALSPEHHRRDMELIAEVGANTIRLAHYQHAQPFYDLCDEYGMIVWAEIPYISRHLSGGRENAISQMKELIKQNYNHPSIVVWGLSNEITMAGASDEELRELHRELNDLVHRMDRTRLTTMAVVSMCDIHDPYIRIPDTVAYNHYFGWYGGDVSMNGPWFDRFHKTFPDMPIGVSEYGCEALNWHTSEPRQGDYTEEYQAYYHEELIKQLFTRPYLWATYVWNMFDFGADARNEGGEPGQNHKGLVTFDRTYKKDAFYAYKAWLSDEPFVHICSKRYVDRVEDVTRVKVYSNQTEVELFADGESLGSQRREDHFFVFDVPNRGETRLTARAGGCTDESVIRKVDVFNEAYRLKDTGTVLNWFDIEQPKGRYSLHDRVSDVMVSDEGRAVIEEMFAKISAGGKQGMALSPAMMEMMGGFTVIRMASMAGVMGKPLEKGELLALGKRLNKIEKHPVN